MTRRDRVARALRLWTQSAAGDAPRQPDAYYDAGAEALLEVLGDSLDDLWDAVIDACPSPSWVVGAEFIPSRSPTERDAWWVFAEPGLNDVPDLTRRQAMRINSRDRDRDTAFRSLADALARYYPKPKAMPIKPVKLELVKGVGRGDL